MKIPHQTAQHGLDTVHSSHVLSGAETSRTAQKAGASQSDRQPLKTGVRSPLLMDMEKRPQSGFTLIELIVAVTIFGVLAGVGIPSFLSVIQNSRTSSQYNDLVTSLYLARSEAVKTSADVTVCARASDTQCGTDWNQGWLVFIDNENDRSETTANVSGTDILLKVSNDQPADNTVTNFGSNNSSASGASPRNYIRYNRDGRPNWSNGSFIICDDRGPESSRAINVVITGDVRRARRGSGSDIPLDVFNREVSCP